MLFLDSLPGNTCYLLQQHTTNGDKIHLVAKLFGLNEVHEGPELLHVVLQRRARHEDAVLEPVHASACAASAWRRVGVRVRKCKCECARVCVCEVCVVCMSV
jgi:hypothetical protein